MSEKSYNGKALRNFRTPAGPMPKEQLYVATNLEHVNLSAEYPPVIWIAAPLRRLYYRFTPAVWAWIHQQQPKANARYWDARDRGEAGSQEEDYLQMAAERLQPLYRWANEHFYQSGIRNALEGVRPHLPPAPASREILERMDEDD